MLTALLSCCVSLWLVPAPCFMAPTLTPEGASSPSPEPQVELKLATDYLHHYYNLQTEPFGRSKRSWPDFASKVKEMQIFFGLNATGELDPETLEMMRSPRCGVPDLEDFSHLQGSRWNKNVITYSVSKYTRDLPRSTVDSLVESAFSAWARASGLTFVRLNSHNADIMVEFVKRDHGDFYPFDGPRGTLAHAFAPGLGVGGDTHFDDDERWTAGDTGFNLLVVATHEFGHALGLKHSRNPESLMYPNYRPSRRANLLSKEDVANVKALYSPVRGRPKFFSRYSWNSLSNPWLVAPLLPWLMEDRCSPDVTFDAVSTLGDSTFFFRDKYLWIKHNQQFDIKEGPISNFMPKIETGIDAAFWVPRRSTAYLIHESMFWTVKGSAIKGKPRALTHFGFPAWVQEVDAAVHIVKTGRTLFFMHDIYWSYNENRRVMDFGYPKYVTEDFPGINATINAAYYKDGFIFFFVGPRVYKYDHGQKQLMEMQSFFGLQQTGGLNKETLDVMRQPRCGVPDVENFSFYPHRPKWKNSTITYKIARYTPDMKREDVDKSFSMALKMWSDATPLRFIRVHHGTADIIFSFAHGAHGDYSPFDGPRGVLAHAFQPGDGIGGDVHFDEDETWTNGKQGYSLFAVAAHELGHSLGLTHSRDPSAIMYPSYRLKSSTQYSLAQDDLLGIQTLYGKPNKADASPQKCDPQFTFDAAAMIEDQIVFFKNRQLWMRTTWSSYWNRLTGGLSRTYLPGINSAIDAAYDIPAKGVAYIFTGHKYWVVQRLKTRSRSGLISDFGFSSRLRQVDAAVHVSEFGKTIFFVGQLYYRFDEQKRKMDPGFPKRIQKDWPGIPTTVDAAFKSQGSIFLISGSRSYQYDFRQNRVVKVISANSWLGC
ncbi:uncharacterized protein mmp20b [Synchiropus picturatus]